jgi:type 1 glutamine amidotransferase
MKTHVKFIAFLLFCISFTGSSQPQMQEENIEVNKEEMAQILVFTKTMGYRHKSIEKGVETLKNLGKENSFKITQTEDSLQFNDANLEKYDLVLFLSTTMDVLGTDQEQAFKNYINNGGNYMGIHAASDTEYDWPWYGKLVGAYFTSHPNDPNVREAKMKVVNREHLSTSHLKETWERNDEWYNYKNINPDMNVLIYLDETSYEGGTNGDNHPIAWYYEFDGGRVFYTGGGHTEESYDEPDFQKHLVGGINYCLGR